MWLCSDCGRLSVPYRDGQCRSCREVTMLLQARAILAGKSEGPVTIEHLEAMDKVIDAQGRAILELQADLLMRREVTSRAC